MADIFLSYARDDLKRVLPLVDVFRAQGWSVWWDREISAGKRFEQVIDEQIRQARCVVVAWSAKSVDSTWVHNEALEGLEREILIPVLLDEVRVPVAFRQNQAALLIGYPDSGCPDQIEFLVRGVRERVGDGAAPDGASAMPLPVAPVSTKQTAKRPLRRWTLYAITVLVAALALWQWAPLPESPFDAAAAITELNRLVEAGNPRTAFAYAREIEPRLSPGALDESWPRFSWPISLETAPPGGTIRFRSLQDADSRWFDLGAAPIENVRVANGLYHLQVTLNGYATLDRVVAVPGSFLEGIFADSYDLTLPPRFALVPNADNLDDMVLVPGSEKTHTFLSGTIPGQYWAVGDYFLRRYEVTNEEFKAFVDAGGYDDRDLFTELDDQSFARAKSTFVDRTGRQGPAGWRLANFAEGEERKPVTGISWYEATAFARFRGTQLPTALHWNHAARNLLDFFSPWLSVQTEAGNFSGAVRDVGRSGVIDPFGTFDMAGNVREWAANTAGVGRAVLGGSYRDPSYMLVWTGALDPWTRDDVTGFRTMRVANAALDQSALLADVGTVPTHPPVFEPIDDQGYALLQSQLAYSKSTPQVHTEDLESVSPRYAVQQVALTYHDEALPLFILRPTDRPPPYNPVVVFPGQTSFMVRRPTSIAGVLSSPLFRLIIESGRAMVWPIYFGSNERYAGELELAPSDRLIYYRDANVTWRKEIGRVIDYLETREDMRPDALAYLGTSYGSHFPIAAFAQEKRFKTLVLLFGGITLGGISEQRYPSLIRGEHHLPRITQPVLMINGQFDYLFPYEQSQKPMFELLGTPATQKEHFLFAGDHSPPTMEILETVTLKVIDWLDRYTPLPAGEDREHKPPVGEPG